MRRITILIGALVALMLVPAASAFAASSQTVNITGTGSGEVVNYVEGGWPATNPPIACSYNGTATSGTCVAELEESGLGVGGTLLEAVAAPGSELAGWINGPNNGGACPAYEEPEYCYSNPPFEAAEANLEVTAVFCTEGTAVGIACGSSVGPPLDVSIEEGQGTVVSDPAGIECTGAAPHSCTTETIEEGTVTLTASPAGGYGFKSWKGCDKKSGIYGVNGRQCTINLTEARSVSAKFVKVWNLTLNNSGGGKVSSKPGGALCLPNCTFTTASFPEGKAVEVLTKPNKHFHFVEFKNGTGQAASCNGQSTCAYVAAGQNSSVEAVFAEDPKLLLALSKEGGGQALIKTKGPGTVCSYTCGSSTARFYTGETVLISWKLGKGTSSLTWTSPGGTCTGTQAGAEGSCEVTMSAGKSLNAKLE